MKLIHWNTAGKQSSIAEMVLISAEAEDLADAVARGRESAQALAAIADPADRVLGIVHPFGYSDSASPLDWFMQRPDRRTWWRIAFEQFAAAGVTPSRIIMDCEYPSQFNFASPFTCFDQDVYREAILGSNEVYGFLPAFLRRDGHVINPQGNRALYQAFIQWGYDRTAKWIRSTVRGAWNSVCVQDVSITNYGDTQYSFPIFDCNGWQQCNTTINGTSAPNLYIKDHGLRHKDRKRHPYWCAMLDCVNIAASCLNVGDCHPWIIGYHSVPGDKGWGDDPALRWCCEQLTELLARLGVSAVNVFNHAGNPWCSLDAVQIAAQAKRLGDWKPVRTRKAIDIEASSITLQGLTVRYSDLAKLIGKAAPSAGGALR